MTTGMKGLNWCYVSMVMMIMNWTKTRVLWMSLKVTTIGDIDDAESEEDESEEEESDEDMDSDSTLLFYKVSQSYTIPFLS